MHDQQDGVAPAHAPDGVPAILSILETVLNRDGEGVSEDQLRKREIQPVFADIPMLLCTIPCNAHFCSLMPFCSISQ
jgi:hypothetical protein